MSQDRRYDKDNRSYSEFHRVQSTRRFVEFCDAARLSMIDLDMCLWCEYVDGTKNPTALVETAKDIGQAHKTTTVMRNLAAMAGLPAYLVLYTEANRPNPAAPDWPDLEQFRVSRVNPAAANEVVMSPKEYAQFLLHLRKGTI